MLRLTSGSRSLGAPADLLGAPWSGQAGPDLANIYLHARYYDPSLGMFLSPDPAEEDSNTYRYGFGNPTFYSDRTGLGPDEGDGNGTGCTSLEIETGTCDDPDESDCMLRGLSGWCDDSSDFGAFFARRRAAMDARRQARDEWRKNRPDIGSDNVDPCAGAQAKRSGCGGPDDPPGPDGPRVPTAQMALATLAPAALGNHRTAQARLTIRSVVRRASAVQVPICLVPVLGTDSAPVAGWSEPILPRGRCWRQHFFSCLFMTTSFPREQLGHGGTSWLCTASGLTDQQTGSSTWKSRANYLPPMQPNLPREGWLP